MTAPENLSYTEEHEWVLAEDGTATVGITDVAATRLGDIVYVDLPSVGTAVTAGEVCGEIESTKSVGELYSPVTGEVIEINDGAVDDPSVVNSDAFGAGWLMRIVVSGDLPGDLMDHDAYLAFAGEA